MTPLKALLTVIFLAATLATGASAQVAPSIPIGEAKGLPKVPPIGAVGHGTIFSPDGTAIKPTPGFIRLAIEYYLDQVESSAPNSVLLKARKVEASIAETADAADLDALVQRSLLLDWMVEATNHADADRLSAITTTLRRSYFTDILGLDPAEFRLHYNSGLPERYLDMLKEIGLETHRATTAGGDRYVRECRDAGVPIPPTWKAENGGGDKNRGGWEFRGTQLLNFASSAPISEVYAYNTAGVDGEPNGLCVALPRISGSSIGLLGVICLGRDTGNACFWDRSGTGLSEEVPISGFVGGADLANADVCSDCHAGESPYVVHPGTSIDLGAEQDSPVWYNPIVKASWPQNPGPTALLNFIPLDPGEGNCTGCHVQNNAGRLPEVGALPQYCSTVISNALVQTMPPGGPGDPAYAKHANALIAFCSQPPPDGEVVPVDRPDEDEGYISPPIIIEPLYSCVTAIEVRGLIYGAKLEVFIDGSSAASVQVTRPSQEIVQVPALSVGQILTATQEKDGIISAMSAPVEARDHKVDFPDGMPKPRIDPTLIHECGRVIAVRHPRGADVTVFVNGGDPRTFTSGGDWTNVAPAIRPFILGDAYSARATMCSDDSPLSDAEVAVAPPNPMPTPGLDPATVYAGQELVDLNNLPNGSLTTVEISGAGAAQRFSTAVSWQPEVDVAGPNGGPLAAGQNLAITAELCEPVTIKFPDAEPCDDIPAPIIAQPFVGDTSVNVIQSVPSSRVLVFDAAFNELGDGSGVVVALNRVIAPGDVLTVVQKVGRCISQNGYRVSALCTSTDDCG